MKSIMAIHSHLLERQFFITIKAVEGIKTIKMVMSTVMEIIASKMRWKKWQETKMEILIIKLKIVCKIKC